MDGERKQNRRKRMEINIDSEYKIKEQDITKEKGK